MWVIDKQFDFQMGHRVWAQKLEHENLSLETECACKHLHGHGYELKVFLESDALDKSNMVTDFKNLNWMKQFLDENLDHKFMIDIKDPMFARITGYSLPTVEVENFTNLGSFLRAGGGQAATVPLLRHPDEHLDSFVMVNFCPTSEQICKHIAELARNKMKGVAKVSSVELWETKKSHCTYSFK